MTTVWERLAAPLAPGVVSWRQDGKPVARDGKHFARFVAYVEAGTVRKRLDEVVPGEWTLALEVLPVNPTGEAESLIAFRARLVVCGLAREDVGQGRDYKQASTDAFKRAAVRFGIAHELYEMGQCWVQVDGDGKYAKPLEDPAVVYARKHGGNGSVAPAVPRSAGPVPAAMPAKPAGQPVSGAHATRAATTKAPAGGAPKCPDCGGVMWDNREKKASGEFKANSPDYKCRDKNCNGVIWPPRETVGVTDGADDEMPIEDDDGGELPF